MKVTQVEVVTLDCSGEENLTPEQCEWIEFVYGRGGSDALRADVHTRFRDHSLIFVHTDEGMTGISRGGNRAMIELLAPILIGQNPLDVERLWQAMYATGPGNRATVAAIGALDIALWDLKGKALGQPIWRLLGGYRNRVPAYGDILVSHRDTPEAIRAIAGWVKQGFPAVKFHIVHSESADMLTDLAAVREAIGSDTQLMVDAHRPWDPWTAAELARQFEQYDVYWLEEPVLWDDQAGGLAVVAAATHRILIAAGEAECTLYAARDLMARGGVRVLQHDIISGGGYTAWRKYAALAEAYHVNVTPHGATFPEFTAQLIAAVSNGLIVSTCPAAEPYQLWSRLYREPLAVQDGWITLTDRPGLGLELDEDFIACHRV